MTFTKPQPETENTRQRILNAAEEIFLSEGYARATTRRISSRAGISEITLFRHFGTKERLFEAVVEQTALQHDPLAGIAGQLTGEFMHDMELIAREIMALMIERRSAIQMMLCEADHFPELQAIVTHIPRNVCRSLAGYLARQIEHGKVRSLPTEGMAQMFWGIIFSYVLNQGSLFGENSERQNSDSIVHLFVDCFVNGTIQRNHPSGGANG